MTSVLMVCLGNICRSPLAQGILESKLSLDNYYIDSAGTAAYHIGEQPDLRSIAVAKKYGIDISNQSARQFKVEDFDRFNYIYAMDQSNFDNILRLARNSKDTDKVQLILDEVEAVTNKNVPDPYYGGQDGFENVFSLLDEACELISKKL